MNKIFLVWFPVFLFVTGSGIDSPVSDSSIQKSTSHFFSQPVQNIHYSSKEEVHIHHVVKGNKLYVDCKVNGYSFREDNESKRVKVKVEINGAEQEYYSAAFVVSNLKEGKNKIKVSIVDTTANTSIQSKTFEVMVSK